MRMYVAASAHAPGGRAALAAFLGGYAAMWSVFGAMAFLGDAGLHAAVDASPWLTEHEWALAPGVLLLAGAFQFSSLKDACLRSCRWSCWQPARRSCCERRTPTAHSETALRLALSGRGATW